MTNPRIARVVRQASKRGIKFHTSAAFCHTPRSIAQLLDMKTADSREIVINGFIRSIRNQKQRSFASIGDGSSLEPLQALLTPEQAMSLSTGTAVRLTGSWKSSPNPKAQSHELHVAGVDIIGSSDPATFPLQKKYHTPEYLRTMPHLRSRIPTNSNLLRLRSDAIFAATESFRRIGYTQTHTPVITSSDCEGAGEVFNVGSSHQGPISGEDDGTFFKGPKYLTVSSQLHLEALSQSIGSVWTLSPTFRAEKSDTARHLSEFYMLEAELSFVNDMQVVMNVVQNLIKDITRPLLTSRVGCELLFGKGGRPYDTISQTNESKGLQRRWERICGDWGQITYTKAIEILQSNSQNFKHPPIWGSGLQAEHERFIATTVANGAPVFVTHYPRTIKPFYMLPSVSSSSERETVDCFDLLVPEACEIVGGSMREHRLEPLLRTMQTNKMIPQGPIEGVTDSQLGELKWYIDLRRWGSVPHGGFGLGFDRLLGYLAGVSNIREVVAFPRWVGRCDC